MVPSVLAFFQSPNRFPAHQVFAHRLEIGRLRTEVPQSLSLGEAAMCYLGYPGFQLMEEKIGVS
jgi:hypothetical protein